MPEIYFQKESDSSIHLLVNQEKYSDDLMKSYFIQIYAKCEQLTLQSKKGISFKELEELNLNSDDESLQETGMRMRRIRLYRNSLAHETWSKSEFSQNLFNELAVIYLRLYKTLHTKEYEQSNIIVLI